MHRRTQNRYRHNRKPPKLSEGPKVLCQQTGFPTYKDRLVEDDYGLLVDPRYGGFDVKDERDDRVR